MSSIIEESKKARRKGFFGIFKNKKVIIPAIIILLAAGGYYYFFMRKTAAPSAQAQKREYTVNTGNIQLGVQSDGTVTAEDGVNLSFQVSGDTLEVSDVYVKQGQQVKKGDKLASVKTDTLQYSLQNAYANYQSALAAYDAKISGPTDDQKTSAQNSIDQAQISLDQANISLQKTETSASSSIANAEDALQTAQQNLDKNPNEVNSQDVRNAYSTLVDTIKSIDISLEGMLPDSDNIIGVDNTAINDSFEANLGAKKLSTLSTAQQSYKDAKSAVASLDAVAVNLTENSPQADIDNAAVQANTTLTVMEKHLYDMKTMLDNTITSASLSQTQLDGFASTINSNRSSVVSKISSLSSDVQAVSDAKTNVDDYQTAYNKAVTALDTAKQNATQDIATAKSNVASRELALKQAQDAYTQLIAPLSAADLASAKASLQSASTNLQNAQLNMDKATLVSPIDGEVAALNYKTGDTIFTSDNKAVVTIINKNSMYIDVNIEEADISKIKPDMNADITFDAIEGLKLTGTVSEISQTAQTSNNGIVTYEVKVVFENPTNSPIKEGMTASVNFITAQADNVLEAPVAAVSNVNGKPSVQLANGQWQPVTTGFTDGTSVEIISGLSAGDKILY